MKPTIPWIWKCKECDKVHEGLYYDPSWFYWCDCGGDIVCLQQGEIPDLDDPEIYKEYFGRDKEKDDATYKKLKEEGLL